MTATPSADRPAELFDTHCHLGFETDDAAAAATATVERARAAGVTRMLDVGIDLASSQRALERATTLDGVFASAGLHPNAAGHLDAEWDALAALAANPACLAVGETGLDFYWDHSTPAEQERAFHRHLELGVTLGKTVIVHCRDAFDRTFAVLADHPDARFVLHCFAGGVDEARIGLELGGYLSFAGPVTYPRSHALREAAAFAPPDRVLVETDAPFLPPQGHRGERNEPARVRITAGAVAVARGVSEDALARTTTRNAFAAFGVRLPT